MFISPDRQFEGCHILVVQFVDLEKSFKSLSLVTRVVSIMSFSEINSKNKDLLTSQCIGSTIYEYLGILFPRLTLFITSNIRFFISSILAQKNKLKTKKR